MSRRRGTQTPIRDVMDEILAKRNLTRQEFARKVGIDYSTYSRTENRSPTKLPKSIQLEKWSVALGLSMEEMKKIKLALDLTWSPKSVQILVATLLAKK